MGVQASSKVDFRALRGFRGFNCFFWVWGFREFAGGL